MEQALTLVSDETVGHVAKLLGKIAAHPDDPKYKRLKIASRLFQERFASPEARRLLQAVGFTFEAEVAVFQGDTAEAQAAIDARLNRDDDLARAIALSQQQPMDEEPPKDKHVELQERVSKVFSELVAQGMPPNDAAAEALRRAQQPEEVKEPQPKKKSFERMDAPELVGDDAYETINLLYKEDGVTFVDPSFPPVPGSLYADAADAERWACSRCHAKNPVPAEANSRDGVLRMIDDRQRGVLREIQCASCGHKQPLLEVGLRPSGWLRPADIRDDRTMQKSTVPWSVFRGDPRPDDSVQGAVGNCWFVCALSVLAQVAPQTLRTCFVTQDLNPAGVYRLRLNAEGVWHVVTVDDLLPVNALDCAAYTKPSRRSLWGPLLEKAAAKMHGSYESLAGGTFAEAFNMITGCPTQRVTLDKYSSTGGAAGRLLTPQGREYRKKKFHDKFSSDDDATLELFAQLYSFKESGFAMGVSTFVVDDLEKEMRGLGLQLRHAYGVLDVKQYDGHLLVKLRNPNGVSLWTGPWSKHDPNFTAKAKSDLGIFNEDPGVFWMPVSSMPAYFVELTVCRILPAEHLEARASGWLASAFGSGDAVAIDVYARSTVEVAVYQEAHARRGVEASTTAVDLGLALIRSDGTLVASSKRQAHRAGAALDATLDQDDVPTRYLAVPLCFGHVQSAEPRKFHLAVHSSEAAVVVDAVKIDAVAIAKACIHIAKTHGSQHALLRNQVLQTDAVVFYALDDEAGYIIVAENRTPMTHVVAEIDTGADASGFVSTRGALASQDIIPPRSHMILCVLSRLASATTVNLSLSYAANVLEAPTVYDPQTAHIPPLADLDNLQGLHAPLPLDDDHNGDPPRSTINRADLAAALQRAMDDAR